MDSTESHLSNTKRRLGGRTLPNASGSDASVSPSITYSRLRSAKRSPSVQRSFDTGPSPELAAPIPLRHAELKALDFQAKNWPTSASPTSSRAISPVSPLNSSSSLLHARYRQSMHSILESNGEVREEAAGGGGRRWIRWMHRVGMKEWVLPATLVTAALVRWCIGMGSYSGRATPPMFGDYEAQRHWMEITIHLPVTEWYRYDLQYWGLDYPPLTAYVSWICGAVGSLISPSWFALDSSRGIETPGSKLYMRATVLAFDYLVYVPSIWMFTRISLASRSKRTQNSAFLTLLFQPALLLVDFGHFQYNSVMLGLTLLAVNCLMAGRDALGAFFFVCSLCFKQMALYYAPAIGMYLVGKCIYLGPSEGLRLLVRLALVTVLSFMIFFLPFLPPLAPLSSILDPITRIFPFNRGIFEDKVANFWCTSNVVFKWRIWASRETLVRLSAIFTIVGFLGAAIAPIKAWLRLRASAPISKTPPIIMQPVLLQALLNSSLSFFLFSFQVHEKTILLPLLPLSLLLVGASSDSTTFSLAVLCNNVAVFSMWPLLERDGLAVQYIAMLILWNKMIGYNPLRHPLSMVVYAACIVIHAAELAIPPPTRYPDIYPVLNVLISTPIFGLTWLWSIKSIIEARWAVGGLSTGLDEIDPKYDGMPTRALGTDERSPELLTALRAKGIEREQGARTASFGAASGKRLSRRRVLSQASAAS